MCTRCGTQNDPARRFCRRCGEWLVAHVARLPSPPAPLGRRLRRRWGGERDPYSRSLTRSTIAFRVLAGVAAGVATTVLLAVVGLHPIRTVTDIAGHVLGSGRVSGVSAASDPADPAQPADGAVDGVRNRVWTTQWVAPEQGDGDLACAEPAAPAATASILVLTLPAPTDLREIGIEAGLDDDALRATRWRPQTLELRWDGGGCQRVDLANVPGLQRFGVDQGEVGGVRVMVVAGYPPEEGVATALDVGEVTFWHR